METIISITDIKTNKKHDINKDEISSLKFDYSNDTLKIFLNGKDEPITAYDKEEVIFNKLFDLMAENANIIDIP